MRPFYAAAGALVALAVAGTAPALGATQKFEGPEWTNAKSNVPFPVYACDGSQADCAKDGAITEGAAEKAHVYCAHPVLLDRFRTLEWKRSDTFRGEVDTVFRTFSDFKIERATEEWASLPSPVAEEASRGQGGWVFDSITCGGRATPAPTGHFVQIRFASIVVFRAKRKQGARQPIRREVNGLLKAEGTFGETRESKLDDGPGRSFRQLMDNAHWTGAVTVREVFQTCRDAACKIKKLTRYETKFRPSRSSRGVAVNSLTRWPKHEVRRQRLNFSRGLVTKSNRPGCKRGRDRSVFVEVDASKSSVARRHSIEVVLRVCRRAARFGFADAGNGIARGRAQVAAPPLVPLG